MLVLEFSKVWKPLAKPYDAYSFSVLPWLGKHVAKDEAAYRYLAESIRMHPDQETLKGMMEAAGLVKVAVLQPHRWAWWRCTAASSRDRLGLGLARRGRHQHGSPGRRRSPASAWRASPARRPSSASGRLPVALTVQTTGEVLPRRRRRRARDLEVRISPFLLPRLAARDESAYRDVETTGDVEFAGEVAFLAKHLKWDVEEDLSKVVGDAAAHRMVVRARATPRPGARTRPSAWPPAPPSTGRRRIPSSPRA